MNQLATVVMMSVKYTCNFTNNLCLGYTSQTEAIRRVATELNTRIGQDYSTQWPE